MLRITSGTAKGRKLNTPDIKGYRAVQDKAKLAIFSILENKVEKATCLDLYAGSGSFGLEALSRGANYCDFVDASYESEKTIRANLNLLDFADKAEVYKQDAIKFVTNCSETYDLIFLDPFYDEKHFRFLFENLQHVLKPNGIIIFSHGRDTDVKDAIKNTNDFEIYDERRYGNAYFTFIKKNN